MPAHSSMKTVWIHEGCGAVGSVCDLDEGRYPLSLSENQF